VKETPSIESEQINLFIHSPDLKVIISLRGHIKTVERLVL
jgi:hypothetical protein